RAARPVLRGGTLFACPLYPPVRALDAAPGPAGQQARPEWPPGVSQPASKGLPGMKVLWLTLALLLSGCSSPPGRPDLPYGAWFIGTTAPDYMETWVESIDVIDRRGWIYVDVSGGVSSMRRSKALDGNPAGWPKRAGRGAGQHMNGIDLPDWIQVRWQSLVEPQTYDAGI